MFSIEIVEGNAQPSKSGTPEYENYGGKTIDLLLSMLKSVCHIGHYVVLDSGFCFL